MPVPFIDLKRFEPGFLEAWSTKIADLTKNTQFIGGEEVQKLEQTLASENQVGHAVACANGTDAIQLALRGCGVGPGDHVLVPNNTFWATFEAVVNVGARPSTVDINPKDLQMDFALFCRAVDELKPKAAIIAHLYGWASADLGRFRNFSRERGVVLVEDGAQCYGVRVNGQPIYRGAHVSTISFYPAKVFGGAGDGGAVLMDDADLAGRVRSLGNHGREAHYAHGSCGWNSRMDTFQAAFLNLTHPHLAARLKDRIRFARRYREAFPAFAVTSPEGIEENGYLTALRFEPAVRTALIDRLKADGIGYSIVYPDAVQDQKGAQGLLSASFGGDGARSLAQSVISLPLFPYMTDAEFDQVVASVRAVVG